MNIPLTRLIEGIVATIRSDIIPHVEDSYARGQAIGVIDLLNNLAPRIEWAREPLARQIQSKRLLLDASDRLVPAIVKRVTAIEEGRDSESLLEARRALDAEIADLIARLWPRRHEENYADAIALIKLHLHDEAAAEMKTTRKPLFAEIASGGAT